MESLDQKSPVHNSEILFREQLRTLSQKGILNGKILVRHTTPLNSILDTIKKTLGYQDLAHQRLIELKTLQFLTEGKQWIKTPEDIELIKTLAKKLGLTQSNKENPSALLAFIHDICTPKQAPYFQQKNEKDGDSPDETFSDDQATSTSQEDSHPHENPEKRTNSSSSNELLVTKSTIGPLVLAIPESKINPIKKRITRPRALNFQKNTKWSETAKTALATALAFSTIGLSYLAYANFGAAPITPPSAPPLTPTPTTTILEGIAPALKAIAAIGSAIALSSLFFKNNTTTEPLDDLSSKPIPNQQEQEIFSQKSLHNKPKTIPDFETPLAESSTVLELPKKTFDKDLRFVKPDKTDIFKPIASTFIRNPISETDKKLSKEEKIISHFEKLLFDGSKIIPLTTFANDKSVLDELKLSKKILYHALEKDHDLCERLSEIIQPTLSSPQQKSRQLQDMLVYLFLLSNHQENEEDKKQLQLLTNKIKIASDLFIQACTAPAANPLERLENLIQELLPKENKLQATSSLSTHKGTAVSDNAFAHIHVESMIKGSPYQGYPSGKLISYLKKYLITNQELYQNIKEFKSLIKMLSDAESLCHVASTDTELAEDFSDFKNRHTAFHDLFCKIIKDLKPGEKTLVDTGWVGIKSSHSMKLSIEREKDETLHLMLFNTGDGIEHHFSLEDQGKKFIQPFVEILDVKEKRLLDPLFTQAFLEILLVTEHPSKQGDATEYGADDLYGIILKGLGGTEAASTGNRNLFISPQESSICSWASLLAVLHTFLPTQDYYKIISDIAFDSLCAFYQSSKNELAIDEEKRHLLHHASVRCAQNTLDAFQNRAISLEEVRQIYATLKELQIHLEKAEYEALIANSITGELNFENLIPISPHNDNFLSDTTKPKEPEVSDVSNIKAKNISAPLILSYDWLDSPNKIKVGTGGLKNFIRRCINDNNQEEGIRHLEQFFVLQARKGTEAVWHQVPQEHTAEILVHLADLGEMLLDAACLYPHRHRTYTAYACYLNALTTILGQKIPELEFCIKSLPWEPLLRIFSASSDKGTLTDDYNLYRPEERYLRKTAIKILRKASADFQNCSPYSITVNLERPWEYTMPQEDKKGIYHEYELEWINQHLLKHPELKEKLIKKYPEHKEKLALPRAQIALAFCDWYGEILPPYFCAVRRQAVIAQTLLSGKSLPSTENHTIKSSAIPPNNYIPEWSLRSDTIATKINEQPGFREINNIRMPQFTSKTSWNFDKRNISEGDVMEASGGEKDKWLHHLKLILTQGDILNKDHFEQQIIKAFSYFSDHLELFNDPETCLLFRYLIFEYDYLEKVLKKSPFFADLLIQFIERGYQQFSERENIAGAVFFIEMGRDLDALFTFQKTISNVYHSRTNFPDFRKRILKKLDIKRENPEENTLLYLQLIATYASHPSGTLTHKEASQLLTAILYTKIFPLPYRRRSTDHLQDQIKHATSLWMNEIQRHLQSEAGNGICNDILSVFTPDAIPQVWNCRDDFPVCKSKNGIYRLDVDSLELFVGDHLLTGLPNSLLTHSLYTEIFSGKIYPTRLLKCNSYEFTDERGIETRIRSTNRCEIRQKLDNHWYQLIHFTEIGNDSFAKLPKGFLDLCKKQSLWISVEQNGLSDQILIRDHSLKITHRLTAKSCIKHSSSNSPLYLVDLNNIPNITLEKFLKGAMLWQDDTGALKELEIPSLDLTFSMKMHEGTWRAVSIDYPGYFIAPNQLYRGIQTILGGIVLENDKGQRKLILPYGKIKPQGEGSFKTTFEIKVKKETTKPSITYDLDKVFRPIAIQKEQQLYLAAILLTQKKYAQAQSLLRQSFSHVLPYNEQEKKLLEQIHRITEKSKDHSPHAKAILFTSFSLLSSCGISQMKPKKIQKLLNQYNEFKQQQSEIPHLWITHKEEKAALNYLNYKNLTLDSEQPSTHLLTPPSALVSEKQKVKFNIESTISSIFKSDIEDPLNAALVTRRLNTDLSSWLKIAYKDPLQLELYLVGAEHNHNMSQEMIAFLRGIAHGYPLYIIELNKLINEKNRNRLSEILNESIEYEKTWQQTNQKKSNSSISIKGTAPLRHPREKEAHAIGVHSNMVQPHILESLADRTLFLNEKQLEQLFKPTENKGLRLSTQEILDLQRAITEGGKGKLPAESQELAQHIQNYWTLDMHSQNWHRLDPIKREHTKAQLLIGKTEMGKKADLLQQELLAFANDLPSEIEDALLFETEKIGHIRQEITLNELILFTARSRHFTLSGKNPKIDKIEKELLDKCLHFLKFKAQLQQLDRAIGHLKDLDKCAVASPEYSQLSENVYQELTRQPSYNAHEQPELLVFEVLDEIGLHDWQVKDLKRMLKPGKKENPNIILEKTMGSGKTKVYLPLLALGNADGDSVSIVVVHSSQYETVAEAMQINSGQKFNQVAHALQFSRNSDTSASALKNILNTFEKVRKQRHFFVVTDKSMHSLGLAFDELWNEYLNSPEENPDLIKRIEIMRQILNLIKTKGKAIFDEVDLLLCCRYEVVYSLGKPKPLNPAHANIVADLYRSIAPLLETLQPFTNETYRQLKPKLIDTFVSDVVAMQMDKVDLELIKNYLMGDKSGENYVKTNLSKKQRNLLAIAYHEFQDLLPIVLDKRCKEHYGYSDKPNIILPVPYVCSGVPSPTSEFSFPYALLDYTIQTLLYDGVSAKLLKQLIPEMQSRATREQKANSRLPLNETQGYKEFSALCGDKIEIPFLKVSDRDIEKIVDVYKDNPFHIYAFAKKYLFPDVKIYKRKLTSTPYTLFNMFFQAQGFTGTPYNQKTYPKAAEIKRDKLSAGKTQGIIWKNSQIVHHLNSMEIDEFMKEIAYIQQGGDYHALIDVGALFNGIDNQKVASLLLNDLPLTFHGVLFYKDNRPHVLKRTGEVIPYEKYGSTDHLYIYYDQWHTTGTDFKINGKSLLTFSKNTKMRDLAQGYMRDRDSALGKRVEFLVSPETIAFIQSELKELFEFSTKITTRHILRTAEIVQERELSDQLLMGTFGQVKETIHHHLRNLQSDPKIPPQAIKQKANEIIELIGDTVKDSPWNQLGSHHTTEKRTFFQNLIDTTIEKMTPLMNKIVTKEALEKELWKCIDLDLLPDQIASAAKFAPEQLMEQEGQRQLQQERMAMVQKELLIDQETAKHGGPLNWNWSTTTDQQTFRRSYFRTITPSAFKTERLPTICNNSGSTDSYGISPCFKIADIFKNSSTYREFSDIFDIETTYNFLPIRANIQNPKSLEMKEIKKGPFEKGQLDLKSVLICKDKKTGEVQVRLISQADTGFFFTKLKQDYHSSQLPQHEVDVTLYNLSLGAIQSNSAAIISGKEPLIDREVLRKIVQAKFFNGESFYTPEETELLNDWIMEKGVERMERLFVHHILPQKRKEKINEYSDSTLDMLFSKFYNEVQTDTFLKIMDKSHGH